MAFSTSKIMIPFFKDLLDKAQTTQADLDSDGFKIALWSNTNTPDNTVANSLAYYNAAASQWVSATYEKYSSTDWAQGGQVLDGVDLTSSTNVIKWDATDEVSSTSNVTITDSYGACIYDTTLTVPYSNMIVCFNAFGGPCSVAAGQLTIVFNASGILTLTF